MILEMRPLAEITQDALKVLYKEIGIINTVRFINQFTTGFGNYTEERDELFEGMALGIIVSDIKKSHKSEG